MARADEQRGSTLIEFLGASLLVVLAFLGVAQMAVWVWARGVTVNAAHEGARAAAAMGATDADGQDVGRAVLRDGLGAASESFAVSVTRRSDAVVAEVRGESPRLVGFMPVLPLVGRATVLDERQVTP